MRVSTTPRNMATLSPPHCAVFHKNKLSRNGSHRKNRLWWQIAAAAAVFATLVFRFETASLSFHQLQSQPIREGVQRSRRPFLAPGHHDRVLHDADQYTQITPRRYAYLCERGLVCLCVRFAGQMRTPSEGHTDFMLPLIPVRNAVHGDIPPVDSSIRCSNATPCGPLAAIQSEKG